MTPREKLAERRIKAQREKSVAKQAEKEERLAKRQRCLEARKQLIVLQEKRPIYRDENGNLHAKWKHDTYQGKREYLDDEARASEIELARQNIAMSCKRPDDAKEQVQMRKRLMISEQCAAIRAQLEALEKPEARSSRQAINDKRRLLEKYCNK